jgi:hypothetical protein
MADKRAGSIFVSSFVAGLLLTAGIFAPRAWEPVPEPYFGLEEPAADSSSPPAKDSSLPRPAERLALNDGQAIHPGSAAAMRSAIAVGQVVPSPVATSRPEPAAPVLAAQVPPTTLLNTPPTAEVQSAESAQSASQPNHQPVEESLRALVVRVQTARPPAEKVEPSLAPSRLPEPPSEAGPLAEANSPAEAIPPTEAGSLAHESLGSAPLPGDEWVDPDSVNWSDAPSQSAQPKPAAAPAPRIGLRGPVAGGLRGEPAQGLRPRLRVAERLLGRDRVAIADSTDGPSPAMPARQQPPSIHVWPVAAKLGHQLEQIASTAASADGAASGPWATEAIARLRAVAATAGPGDPAAESELVTLGESVHAGMGIADSTADHASASLVRRAALALARRVAVWRSAAGLFAVMSGPPPVAAAPIDAAAHAIIATETAKLLDSIERFEVSLSPVDAALAATALGALEATGHPGTPGVAKAVRDHYLSANVRVAVHQQFLEKMLPETTVMTGPVDEFVMGRKVRGTRTVEQSTKVRFTPDSDEICFDLEVHGDVSSRTVTDAAGVSLTSHGDSSFTVRKPIKICSEGLLFGNATGVASNRTQLANVQTSFDSVPIMRSVVRNIVRNQHDESLPQANREVIDRIINTSCREVDAQSEPKFAEIAERIREQIWSPMVRLGLEPTPVGMETTPTTATLRLRLAGDDQLAAHTPRPRTPADAMLSLQVHDSTINNALERLELGGRRLSLEELIRLMCERIGVEQRVPDDLPEGVTVSFAKVQPLRVECRDGLVHVRVALDAIESGRRNWYDIVAHVAYKPSAVSPQVFLEREGPVQLSGPGHQGRIEFALRTIFSKIFPKERPIPLLPERMVGNPRLAGMHAVQTVSNDGWFSLALGLREPAAVAAEPAKTASDRRKPFFK